MATQEEKNQEIKDKVFSDLKRGFGLSEEDIKKVYEMEAELLKEPPASLIDAMKAVEKHHLNIPQLIYQVVSLTGTNQVLIEEIQKLHAKMQKEGSVPKEEPKKPKE